MDHILTLSDITKKFSSVTALDHASLAVKKGELISLLGPSGCGKTTVLNIIAGLAQPDEGLIVYNGADITSVPCAKRNFGIVFQSYALFPNMNVFENIAYGLENRKMAKKAIAEKVSGILDLVSLGGYEKRYPCQLSGGQQQRVSLARALVITPSILLLDEPLSALDAKVRVRMRSEIRQLQRKLGITTIMVTHDQDEALSMSDRVAVMKEGSIVQIGSPEDIYERPAEPFVADFIGEVNFIDASGSLVAVRPEHVEILENGDEQNGVISDIEYRGSFYCVRMKALHGREEITALLSPARMRSMNLAVDQRISFMIDDRSSVRYGCV